MEWTDMAQLTLTPLRFWYLMPMNLILGRGLGMLGCT